MRTDIINKTNQSFELKEGNAGAYRLLKLLEPEEKHSIKVDPNATYREYMVATGKKGESIILTSDDFSEFKVIEIVHDTGENPGYKSRTSNPRNPGSSKASEASNVGGAGSKSKAEGVSNAGVGPDPPASSAAAVGSVSAVSSPAGVETVPPASSAATVGSVPAVSSPAGVETVPPASSAAAVGSVPAVSSPAGVESVPPASSATSSKPSKSERVPWYRKLLKSVVK